MCVFSFYSHSGHVYIFFINNKTSTQIIIFTFALLTINEWVFYVVIHFSYTRWYCIVISNDKNVFKDKWKYVKKIKTGVLKEIMTSHNGYL